MKIALGQIDIQCGKPEENLNKMLDFISQAKKQDVDIIAFPEMATGGYLIGDLWLDDDYCLYLMSFNEKIKEASKNIGIIFGNVYLEERTSIGKNHTRHFDGRQIKYNAAYFYYNKEIVKRQCPSKYIPEGIQPKILLPNYRYFDDKRYFFSPMEWGTQDSIYEISAPFKFQKNGKIFQIGVQLCEDMWSEDYRINPIIALRGSDIIINISASPWTHGKNEARDRKVKKLLTQENKSLYPPYAYVNCSGAQNNGKNILTFDGGSTVYGKDGEPKILSKEPYKEELIIFDHHKIPIETKKRKNTSKIEGKYKAIIRGIKHMSEVTGIKKYVIATSGGIDSSLVLALLSNALGKENVFAINMPTKYNSEKTMSASSFLTKKLGISYMVKRIDKLVEQNNNDIIHMITMYWDKKIPSVVAENIQAKIRTTSLLSNFAQSIGALFPNNGNKIEIALGYSTLYGDWGGCISPIGDLTKSEVYELGRYLNKEIYKEEVIPNELFPNELYQFSKNKIQPSAELKKNQIDPIKIGYHCKLIELFMNYKKNGPNQILQWWLEGNLHTKLEINKELLKIYKMDNAQEFINDLKWFCKKIRENVFKRIQSPPIITLTKESFGFDLRESILPATSISFNKKLENKIIKKGKYE